jgi:hypothetical protein
MEAAFFLSRYSPGGALQIAFLPDQVDLLIQNLTSAVAVARSNPPEKRSSSLLIRLIDFLFPDVLFEKETSMDFTGVFCPLNQKNRLIHQAI